VIGTISPDSSGDRDELARWHQFAAPFPAHQCFGADNLAVDDVHFRLVVHHQLLALQRAV
jgi:hypothetical protein